MLRRFLVIEASAIALSADSTNSKEIKTGNNGANSTQRSMSSKIGVREVRAAESIGTCQFNNYWGHLSYQSRYRMIIKVRNIPPKRGLSQR